MYCALKLAKRGFDLEFNSDDSDSIIVLLSLALIGPTPILHRGLLIDKLRDDFVRKMTDLTTELS